MKNVILGVIFAAIMILALIALNGDVSTFFSSVWSQFSTWALGKLTTLFT